MKQCSNCGLNFDDDMIFCANCGSQLSNAQQNESDTQNGVADMEVEQQNYMPQPNVKKKTSSKIVIAIIIAVFVIGAVGGGSLFAYDKYQDKLEAEYDANVEKAMFLMNKAVQNAIYTSNWDYDNEGFTDKEEVYSDIELVDEYYKAINNPPKRCSDKLVYTSQMYDSYKKLISILYDEGITLSGDSIESLVNDMMDYSDELKEEANKYLEASKAIHDTNTDDSEKTTKEK